MILIFDFNSLYITKPIPVAVRSDVWFCSQSLAGTAGSNTPSGMDVLSTVAVVCCQVEVAATGRSFVQSSPTKYGCLTECDRETLERRPWPARGRQAMKNTSTEITTGSLSSSVHEF